MDRSATTISATTIRNAPAGTGLVAVILCALLAVPTSGQDRSPYGTFSVLTADNVARMASHGVSSESCAAAADLIGVLSTIVDVEQDARSFSATASMSLRGDEAPAITGSDGSNAGEKSRSNVNIGISLDRGSYPSQLSFNSNIGVIYSDGAFDENVSTVHLSVDHYVTPMIQPYAFVHRRSDNFMSIDQRYEIGGGAVFDWHPLGYGSGSIASERRLKNAFTKSGRGKIQQLGGPLGADPLSYGDNALPHWAECYRVLNKLDDSPATTAKIRAAIDEMNVRWKEALDATRKKHTRLRLGLLVGVFYELETAAINTGDATLDVPGERAYRLQLRPTIRMKPVDWLTLRTDFYYKKSLSDDLFDVAGDDADYRSNLQFSVSISQFGGSRNGGIRTSTRLTYTRFYDNLPPQVGDVIARKRHSTFGMTVAVGL